MPYTPYVPLIVSLAVIAAKLIVWQVLGFVRFLGDHTA